MTIKGNIENVVRRRKRVRRDSDLQEATSGSSNNRKTNAAPALKKRKIGRILIWSSSESEDEDYYSRPVRSKATSKGNGKVESVKTEDDDKSRDHSLTNPKSCLQVGGKIAYFEMEDDFQSHDPSSKNPKQSQQDGDEIASDINTDDHLSRDPQPANSREACEDIDSYKPADNLQPWMREIASKYHVGNVIGSGGYGVVHSGMRKSDRLPVAIKRIPKCDVANWGKIRARTVPMEFQLLKCAAGHSGVIKMIGWFEMSHHFILIMEKPSPVVDLFDHLFKTGPLPEQTARNIFTQVAKAVSHCHRNGVLHRDIKDENVLLNLRTMKTKLIDFGCGAVLHDNRYVELYGTPIYTPPEWFQSNKYYGRDFDVWGLGVLLYKLVENSCPFRSENEILTGKVVFRQDLSKTCQDLILKILSKDPNTRPHICDILNHRWFDEA